MSRAKLPSGLTRQQEGFAQAVAGGMSHTEAYKANYDCSRMKPNTTIVKASELAAHGKVSVRISELRAAATAKAVERLSMDKADVLEVLVRNIRRMSEDVPVQVTDEDGNTRIEKMPPSPAHIQAANRALELLGKELGMFVDRKEVRTGPLDGKGETELQAHIAALEYEIKRLETRNAATRH